MEEYPGTATTSVETIGRQGASADDAGCTRTILEEPLEIEPVEGAVA